MPMTRVNDIDVNYKLEGDGPETIVLINGLADDLETWAFQMDDFLGAGYRVLRFDNRGIGASSKPAGPYSSRMLADDAKALVDSLGISDFHLMGVSMGGMIAQEYALAYGSDLRSATFACTYAAPGPFCSRMFAMWEAMAPITGVPFIMRDVTLWAFTVPFFTERAEEAAEFETAMRYMDQPAGDSNPFHTAAHAFIPFVAPLITWVFLSSVTSSYVAANTQTSRVIFAGARGGLWTHTLAAVTPRFRTPAAAAIAFVAPSILIGVVSTWFTDPGTASGFLGTYGILGLIIMYLATNVALVVEWVKFRRHGIHKNAWLWLVTPIVGAAVLLIPIWGDLRPGQPSPFNTLPWLTLGLIAVGVLYAIVLGATRPDVLERAPALLEGEESLETDPMPAG
jgi:pimeloyl-ACP methyl ester carboxylesterase